MGDVSYLEKEGRKEVLISLRPAQNLRTVFWSVLMKNQAFFPLEKRPEIDKKKPMSSDPAPFRFAVSRASLWVLIAFMRSDALFACLGNEEVLS